MLVKILLMMILMSVLHADKIMDEPEELNYKTFFKSEISLKEAIRRALLFQPKIALAKINLDKAVETKKAADNYWHPVVDFNYTNRLDSSLDERTSPNSEKVESYTFSIKQDLNLVRTRIDKNIADYSLNYAEISEYLENQNIALGIAILYTESVRYMLLGNIARERQEILDQYYSILEKRFEIGAASELQLKRISVAIKRSRSEEAFLERRLRDSLSILASSIGLNNIEPEQIIIFSSEIEKDTSASLEKVFQENLVLRLARIDKKNTIERMKKTRWQLYPDVSAVVSRSYDEYREGDDGTNTIAEIKVGFNIWDGLSRRSNHNNAIMDIFSSDELIKDVYFELRVDHEKFTGMRENAVREYLYSNEAKKEALKLLELQKISFERGEGTTTNEIVSAVQEWSDSSSRETNSFYDVLIQDFQLMNLTSELCEKYCI